MTDKRALILRFCDEQQAIADKATKGPWRTGGQATGQIWAEPTGLTVAIATHAVGRGSAEVSVEDVYQNAALLSSSRQLVPLLLGAIRAACEAHRQLESGYCIGCKDYYNHGPEAEPAPCPTVDRIFAALGLEEKAE